MQLVPNWRAVLRRAWSVRLMWLAAVLSGLEVLLPFATFLPIPTGLLAAISFVVTVAAMVARLVAQKGLTNA